MSTMKEKAAAARRETQAREFRAAAEADNVDLLKSKFASPETIDVNCADPTYQQTALHNAGPKCTAVLLGEKFMADPHKKCNVS